MSQQLTKIPDDLRSAITKMGPQFKLVLPRHLSPERFTRLVFTAVQTNSALLNASKESLIAAMMKAAEQGIMPDGINGALVPYKGQVQFLPMWQGLWMRVLRNNTEILDGKPGTIHQNDNYKWVDYPQEFHHERAPFGTDRGEMLAVYFVVRYKDGTDTLGPGPMSIEEVHEIRKKSAGANSPAWRDYLEAMGWKTILKRVLKYVRGNDEEIQAIVQSDDEAEFGVVQMPTSAAAPDEKSTTPTTTTSDNVEDIRRRIAESQAQEEKQGTPPPVGKPYQDDQGSWWVTTADGEEQEWNETSHSSGRDNQGRPLTNQDGSFRRRRVVATKAEPTAPTQEPPASPGGDDSPPVPTVEAIIAYITTADSNISVDEFLADALSFKNEGNYTLEEYERISSAANERYKVLMTS